MNAKLTTIVLAAALFVGFIGGYWVIRLDPEGTGGSILAIPAILSITLITLSLLLASGVSWMASKKIAPYFFLASVIIPLTFLAAPSFLRMVFGSCY